jgi:hypothetical protein
MKIGDLVQSKRVNGRPRRAGLIVDVVQKKCWRTHERGPKVRWGDIEPEPHAVVLVDGSKLTIPIIDLEPLNEG